MWLGVYRYLRILFFLLLGATFFICSPTTIASEFDYNQYRGTTELQNMFADYMVDVRSKIQHNWFPPDYLQKDGHALVTFSITRRGDVISTEIIESSGDDVFDESALEAIRKAAPFDKFPASTAKGSLTIRYSFDTSLVNTGNMQKYMMSAEKMYNVDNQLALEYMNKAINEVDGDIHSYFLYGKRSKIKRALGDIKGAEEDLLEAKALKSKFDKKRIMSSKLYAEMDQSPYAYFSLAHAYEIAEDYQNALISIDKAIALTELNQGYRRYKEELIQKQRPRY